MLAETRKQKKNKTLKNNLIAPLETKTTAAIQIEIRRRKLKSAAANARGC
jgi:hypothetical protein